MKFIHISLRVLAIVSLLAVFAQSVHQAAAQDAAAGKDGAAAPATTTDDAMDNAAGAVTVTERGTFELHVVNQPITNTLRQLSFQSQRNIVPTPNVSGNVTFDLYDVTLEEALNAMMVATGLQYVEQDGFIYVMTQSEYQKYLKERTPIETRVFTLAYLTAEDAEKLIAPAMSDIGAVQSSPPADNGIAQSKDQTGGNKHAADNILVVRDYEPNLNKIADLLQAMDVQPQQVLIEATILTATLTEDEALGVNLSILFNNNFGDLVQPLANGTTLPFLPFGGNYNSGVNLANGSPTNIDVNSPTGGLNSHLTGNFPQDRPAVSIGVLTNNVSAFIEAIEGVRDVTVVANPKLLIVNKQRGEILIGKQQGYLTTTVTDTTAVQTVQFLESGTRLLVRPFVGRDGIIRMEIHPEDSDGDVQEVGNSGEVLPNKTTTEMTSNVMVRDGRTIVIGGLFRDTVTLDRQQLPGVGDMPVVGAAFRSTSDQAKREEVIILLTPHIVDFPAAEAVSERAKDDVERFRVGARRGLPWWSRSRMAETYYHWAQRDYTRGNLVSANYNIDMALTADPHFADAIRLQEKISGKAFWASAPQKSFSRYYVERQMMQEIGIDPDSVLPPSKPLDLDRIKPDVRRTLGIEAKPTESGVLPDHREIDENMTTFPPGASPFQDEPIKPLFEMQTPDQGEQLLEQVIEHDDLAPASPQPAEAPQAEPIPDAGDAAVEEIENNPPVTNNVTEDQPMGGATDGQEVNRDDM